MCKSGPIHRDAECSGSAGKQLALSSFKILEMSNIDQRIVVPGWPTTAITTPELRFVMNEADLKGGLTVAESLSKGVRHPRAFVLGERADDDVCPYATPKEQQSETQSEY